MYRKLQKNMCAIIRRPILGSRLVRPSSPQTATNTKTTVTTEKVDKVFGPYSFKFVGNESGCKVQKSDIRYGDGDMGGGDNFAIVKARMDNVDGIVKMTLRYIVQEPNYLRKSNNDSLEFTKEVNVLNLDSLFPPTTTTSNNCKITKTYNMGLNTVMMGQVYYKDKVGSGSYKQFKPYNYGCQKRDWLPWENLQVKVDDKGSELNAVGNIGVTGQYYVYVTGTATVTTVETLVDTASTVGTIVGSKGTQNVIPNLSSVKLLTTVMGSGYDLTEKYAETAFVKQNVLDLTKLNEDKHIRCLEGNFRANQRTYKGKTYDEYTKDVTTQLNVNVSGHVFGGTFSSENSWNDETHTTSKNKCEFFSAIWKRPLGQYNIMKSDPSELWYYVRPEFLTACNELSRYKGTSSWLAKVKYFFTNWGTHVLLGYEIGGAVTCDYVYKQHISSEKSVHSFKTTNSVGYNSEGSLDSKAEVKKPNGVDYEKLLNILKQMESAKDIKLLIDTAQASSDKKKDDKKADDNKDKDKDKDKKSGSKAGWGISVSGSYEEKEEEYSYHEDEVTIANSDTKGGSYHPDPQTATNEDLNKWFATVTNSNSDLIDFQKDGLLPIYTLIPDSTLRNTVYEGWVLYFKEKGMAQKEAEKGEIEIRVNVRGTNKGVDHWNNTGDDFDVYAKKGRNTAYKLAVDVINIEDTNQAALSVYFQVAENATDVTNKDKTNICFVQVIPINIPYTAVDVERVCASGFLVTGYDNTGGVNINITDKVADANRKMLTQSDIKAGRKCPIIADANHPVIVHLDGQGSDQTNIGYEFTAYVPYLKYDN